MRRAWSNERGMALAVALFALVVVGALVAGAFFVGTQEQRMGDNQYRLGQSLGVAEAGAPELIRAWNPDSINTLRTYPLDSIRIGDRRVGSIGSFGGTMWKLNRNLYYIALTGEDTLSRSNNAALRRRGGGARQRIGILARIRPIQIPTSGAFVSQGRTDVRGNVLVDGTDHQPNATWTDCLPPDSVKPAIYHDGPVNRMGSAILNGNPPVKQDTAINNNTFNAFGDVLYADLAARANIVFPGGITFDPIQPSTVGGVCNKTDQLNWGDGLNHANPCGSYFPIVHIKGDADIRNWQGQGFLLVDGNLIVSGNFEYFGVVIVKGSLITSGGGAAAAHFHGTVMAQNSTGGYNDLSGSAKVRYSKCAIVQALNMQSRGALARSRSWVSLN